MDADKDPKVFRYQELDSNERIKGSIVFFNKIAFSILLLATLFDFILIVTNFKELSLATARTSFLVAVQLVSYLLIKKWSQKQLAFLNIAAFYLAFLIYPFFGPERSDEVLVFLPFAVLIFLLVIPLILYKIESDKNYILGWQALMIITFLTNFSYQYLSFSSTENEIIFFVFKEHPMTLLGFLAACIFTVILFYKYRAYSHAQHNKFIELNNTLTDRLVEIFEQNNEKQAQNEELRAVQEEMTAIKEELEKKVANRSKKLSEQKNEVLRYGFMNSHILRAPVARLKGLIHLKDMSTDEAELDMIDELIKKTIHDLDYSSKTINQILANENKSQLAKIEEVVAKMYPS